MRDVAAAGSPGYPVSARAIDGFFRWSHVRRAAWVACVLGSVVAGVAVARGGFLKTAVLGLAVAIVIAIVVAPRAPEGFLFVELPIFLVLLSNQVIRVRDAEALASNPLDSAAQFRVGAMGMAAALGILGLLSQRETGLRKGLPFKLYGVYVFVVFLGAIVSVDPFLTAYRGIELAASLCVLAGAVSYMGKAAAPRMLLTLYWFAVAILGSVWLGMLHSPEVAMRGLSWGGSPLTWQIQGTLPTMAPNTVGLYAVVVALWSLALVVSPFDRPRINRLAAGSLVAIAIITLVLSQYRTGYIAFALGLFVLALTRGRKLIALLAIGVVALAITSSGSFTEEAQPFLLRGQTVEEAQELSGRLDWWSLAIPVWQRSPLIGRGLLTASRFEVLAANGYQSASTLHGTWVEALVGTGLLGVVLLASAFFVSLGRAIKEAVSRKGAAVPLVLLLAIAARSATGGTFEAFQYVSVLFAAIGLWLYLGPRSGDRSSSSSYPGDA